MFFWGLQRWRLGWGRWPFLKEISERKRDGARQGLAHSPALVLMFNIILYLQTYLLLRGKY